MERDETEELLNLVPSCIGGHDLLTPCGVEPMRPGRTMINDGLFFAVSNSIIHLVPCKCCPSFRSNGASVSVCNRPGVGADRDPHTTPCFPVTMMLFACMLPSSAFSFLAVSDTGITPPSKCSERKYLYLSLPLIFTLYTQESLLEQLACRRGGTTFSHPAL